MYAIIDYYNYLNTVVLGPRNMWYIENILAVLLVLTYIVLAKWFVSTILIYWVGITRHTADWFSYVLVVIITPAALYYLFYYEITILSIVVFVVYSTYWLLTRVWNTSLGNI